MRESRPDARRADGTRGVAAEDPAEKARREAEELAADRERMGMFAEEERIRALNSMLERYMRSHALASARVMDAASAASRRAALRAAVAPQEVAALRSPAARKALKADVKKSISLSKRAVAATGETIEGLLKDIATTALGRYAGEIALDIGTSDALRVGDLDGIIQVCSAMHLRYAHFSPVLLHTVLAGLAHAAEVTGVGAVEEKRKPAGGEGGSGGAAAASPPPKKRTPQQTPSLPP